LSWKPWQIVPASVAHATTPVVLNLIFPFMRESQPEWDSFAWKGLKFRNRVGIAGGVDKNAKNLNAWTEIGYGFLEIGTVTPRQQSANPGKTVGRDWKTQTVWNKLGFPNEGCEKILSRLSEFSPKKKTPIIVNIGKNRDTPNERANQDYIALLNAFRGFADIFAVNISSPNTTGLRELLKRENFEKFLAPIAQEATEHGLKILLKLSPDMTDEEIKNVIDISIQNRLDGWILTNSTVERPASDKFPEGGGITGLPLKVKSREFLRKFVSILGPRKEDRLIISVGGILDSEEMKIRRSLGADLIQVYSALIFHGPNFVKKLKGASN
jgi:dihydroorotate dehydrogenase